ncbi:MAG: metal ABC transporter substrate-binding protein [Lachnospiraceae bacterium]|nr:metal ABC transporter substrate-binding protein [Lachnospiraceae bacterium]
MKKILTLMSVVLMAGTFIFGCKKEDTQQEEKISVVTTIFPEYDWAREITKGSNNVDVTMLLDDGVDLHSFQPTADDMVKISECDMFIYVGGESDEWVEDALREATNKEMRAINLLEVLGNQVKEEEIVEGMESEDEHEHEHGESGEQEEETQEESPEYDEHVWLSLKNTEILCQYIADEIGKMDADNKSKYDENVKAYIDKLTALDEEYKKVVDGAEKKTLLFGDRFPFRYLVDDYGLDYYAAFVGCSAETEASFETITFLAKKMDELELSSIFQIESSDGKIAETIKENTKQKNQQIHTLDSMQSITSKDVKDGKTYLEIMKNNLGVLKQALN